MNRDFYDDDLVKPREEVKRVKMGLSDEADAASPADPGRPGPNRPVSDLNISLMARHRKRVESDSARTIEELERLRQQQETLEREKRDLEEARRKQTDYEKGKRELLDALHQSLVTIERNEVKTQQLGEMLQDTRKRFRAMLEEVSELDEDSWPEERVREELGKALVLVEDARMEYNKAMARIEAVLNTGSGESRHSPVLLEDSGYRPTEEKSFAEWIKVGLAVSLPLLILLAVLCAVLIWQAIQAAF